MDQQPQSATPVSSEHASVQDFPTVIDASLQQSNLVTNKKRWINVFVLLALVLCLAVGFFLGKFIPNFQKQTNFVSKEQQQANTVVGSVIPGKTFQQALAQGCLGDDPNSPPKILRTALPFKMDEYVQKKYGITNDIPCYIPTITVDGNAGPKEKGLITVEDRTNNTSLYLFHKDSQWEDFGDPIGSLESYKKFTINGKQFFLEVLSPDPYGISSLGLWVRLVGEKFDTETGTTARVAYFLNLDGDVSEWSQLIKKYGTRRKNYDEDKSEPEYFVDSNNAADALKEELVELIVQSGDKWPYRNIRNASEEVSVVMDGIVFQ